MHRKLIFPAIFFMAFLVACTEETSGDGSTKDSPAAKADSQKPKQGMTVNEPVSPVPKQVSDSIYNGEYIERYDNGVIRKRGDIAGGVAHGEWMSFYPDGKIWSKGTYKGGLRQGYGVSYHENGTKSSEGYYKDGNFVGVWKFWDEYGNMSERDYGDGGK
jgi:antitoxin component YwqK of YwqJK toxin-antitoxin module